MNILNLISKLLFYPNKHKGPCGSLRKTLSYKKNHAYWLVTQIVANLGGACGHAMKPTDTHPLGTSETDILLKMGFQTYIFCSKCTKCNFRDTNFQKISGGMPPDPPRIVMSIWLPPHQNPGYATEHNIILIPKCLTAPSR